MAGPLASGLLVIVMNCIISGHAAAVTAQEYVYEAEMEEAYRGSLLKAFNKTLNEGFFSMVIVDAINHKVCFPGSLLFIHIFI